MPFSDHFPPGPEGHEDDRDQAEKHHSSCLHHVTARLLGAHTSLQPVTLPDRRGVCVCVFRGVEGGNTTLQGGCELKRGSRVHLAWEPTAPALLVLE